MGYKAYATLNQINSAGWIGTFPDTSYNDTVLRLLQDASVSVDDYTKRQFGTKEETRYFDGAGQSLFLDDLLSITTMTLDEDGSQDYATNTTTQDYHLYPQNKYPKTYAKTSLISNFGSFASGVKAGVKITGIWGYGDGESATPYVATGDSVQNASLLSSNTVCQVSAGTTFSAGQTLRLESEQVYVTAISNNNITLVRGINGTTAANHAQNVAISAYQYPGPIVEATLIQATRWWKRRESAFQTAVGSPEIGQVLIYKGLDPDVQLALNSYIKRSF